MILCDTGPLLCMVDSRESRHQEYRRWAMRQMQPMISTWPCFVEAMYLAFAKGGWSLQQSLLKLLQRRMLEIYEIRVSDYDRLFELMERYRDRPMDFADATLVLAAERLGIRQILTIDSDFLFYRIDGNESFEVISVE